MNNTSFSGLQDYLEMTLNANPTNIALLLKYLYYSVVRYNGKRWYHFKGHRWYKIYINGDDDLNPLEFLMKNELVNKYLDLSQFYSSLVPQYRSKIDNLVNAKGDIRKSIETEWKGFEWDEEWKWDPIDNDSNTNEDLVRKMVVRYTLKINDLIYKTKMCSEMCINLTNHSFLQKIITVCEHFFLQSDFSYLLNSNTKFIGFENGVFNLETGNLENGHPNQLVSMSVGYDCTWKSKNSKKGKKKKDTGKNQWEEISQLFKERYPILQIYGLTDHKHLLQIKNKIIECLGDYWGELPISMLGKKKFGYNETNTELVANCKKRIIIMEQDAECISNSDFNSDVIELLLKNEFVHTRKAYEKSMDYRLNFGILILSELDEVVKKDGVLSISVEEWDLNDLESSEMLRNWI